MDLEQIVNRSGFPLQIAIETMIEKSGEYKYKDWKVLYSEHAWENEKGESGFIDLILEFSGHPMVLVIECKRVRDTTWLFLNKEGVQKDQRHAKAWISSYDNENQKFKTLDWTDLNPKPYTTECEFCVVPGHDNKSAPMLERTAASLIASTEAFANEERPLFPKVHQRRFYLNVIVTTAKLNVCTFDPLSISLADGEIKGAKFHEVPYLRFRKQLQTAPIANEISGDSFNPSAFSRAKENTVFVVNAVHLGDFLKDLDVGLISRSLI